MSASAVSHIEVFACLGYRVLVRKVRRRRGRRREGEKMGKRKRPFYPTLTVTHTERVQQLLPYIRTVEYRTCTWWMVLRQVPMPRRSRLGVISISDLRGPRRATCQLHRSGSWMCVRPQCVCVCVLPWREQESVVIVRGARRRDIRSAMGWVLGGRWSGIPVSQDDELRIPAYLCAGESLLLTPSIRTRRSL